MSRAWMLDICADGDAVHLWDQSCCGSSAMTCVPVVVIDPKDSDRLYDAYRRFSGVGDVPQNRAGMQAALYELANPKPVEPTGIGAVVRDDDGLLWVRAADGHNGRRRNWLLIGAREYQTYDDINAAEIVSEGRDGMTTACVIAAVVIFCLGLFAALVDRTTQRDDALDLLAASEAECEQLARVAKAAAAEALQLDQENMRLHLELAEAQLLAGTGRVPLLRVVPNGGQS